MKFEVISVAELYGDTTLAGASNGQAFLSKLISSTAATPPTTLLVLDFSRIEVVTASFFRSAIRAFRDYVRADRRLYLICANANHVIREEAAYFAREAGDAFLFAKFKESNFSDVQLLGRLDEKQARAFNAVIRCAETDAVQLKQEFPDEDVKSSGAWSNRLAALSAKGLLLERIEGRVKKYRPILGGINLWDLNSSE